VAGKAYMPGAEVLLSSEVCLKLAKKIAQAFDLFGETYK
jgi:hypothetical protein